MKSRLNVIIIIVACIGILVFVGVLVDAGYIYFERKQLSQATDYTALRATTFLPLEQEAHEAVLAFLKEEVYSDQNWEEVQVIINAGDVTERIIGSSEIDRPLIIWIDTSFARISDAKESINTANSIRVKIRREVPTNFLWLFGIRQISIEDTAQAKTALTIMMTVVSDISGSTKIGTLCENYEREWTRCNESDFHNVYETVGDAIRANLDDTTNGNLANIVTGMKRSIAMFSSASGEYEQSRAVHVILIITDKTPNGVPDDEIQGRECWQEDLWAGADSENESHRKAADCAIHYARKAAENNTIIEIISVGSEVDQDLMQEIPIIGKHQWVPTVDKLEEFDYEQFLFGIGPRIVE